MQVLNVDNKRSFKRYILVLSILLLILIPPNITNAAVIDEEDIESQNDPGLIEKHLAELVINVANGLISLSGAQDVTVLVFQRPDIVEDEQNFIANTGSADRSELVFGIFPEGVFDGIALFYDAFASLLPLPVLLILVIFGIMLLFDVMRSVDNRSKVKDVLLGTIFAVILIRFGHIFWDWIIYINFFIVDTVYYSLQSAGINVTSFISTIWNPTNEEDLFASPSFMIALLVLGAAIVTFTINYQYMLRTIVIGVLIVLFPIVVLATIIPSRKNVLSQWFSQFVSQVFLQSAHAIALGLFFFFLAFSEDVGFWLVMVMFFGLPMISDIVKRTLSSFMGEGFGGGVGTSFSNASGMSSLMGVAMLGKNLFGSKGGSGSGKSRTESSARNLRDKAANFGDAKGTGSAISSSTSEKGRGLQTGSSLSSVNASSLNSDSGLSGSSGFSLSNRSGSANNPIVNTSSGLSNSNVKTSSGLRTQMSQGGKTPKINNGVAQVGKAIRRVGNGMAHSKGLKTSAKVASTLAMAGAGYAFAEMVAGKGKSGAQVGGLAGKHIGGRATDFALEKGGKMTELGGEVIQSKAQGNEALALTKERLGYHDSAQLSDSQEMARMGEELFGGATGRMLGKTAGSLNYTAGKYNISPPNQNKFNPKEAYEAVNEKRNLDNIVLPQSERQVVEAKQKLDDMNSQLTIAKANVKANPDNKKYKQDLKNVEQQQAKAQLIYENKKRNHEELKNQATQYYENRKLKKQSESLRQTRRSSGRI